MTDQMLGVARESQPKVAAALGYDNVEFRDGFLERIPLDDRSAHVVTSNCVINLSPDKPAVLREIWRVLEDRGRAVIADIVAEGDVPAAMRADGQLWGECISGAMSEEAFLAAFERAGFYGVSLLKKTFWREVEGTRFHSVTVRGYKFDKRAGCRYVGQYAVYLGPMKAVVERVRREARPCTLGQHPAHVVRIATPPVRASTKVPEAAEHGRRPGHRRMAWAVVRRRLVLVAQGLHRQPVRRKVPVRRRSGGGAIVNVIRRASSARSHGRPLRL
jgi:ubiquinone/menaquinone biosynthesis C-methylase UbiE